MIEKDIDSFGIDVTSINKEKEKKCKGMHGSNRDIDVGLFKKSPHSPGAGKDAEWLGVRAICRDRFLGWHDLNQTRPGQRGNG